MLEVYARLVATDMPIVPLTWSSSLAIAAAIAAFMWREQARERREATIISRMPP